MALSLREAGSNPGAPSAGPRQSVPTRDLVQAVGENAPGVEIYAGVRDSLKYGGEMTAALKDGRYKDAIFAYAESTAAALSVLPVVPSFAGVIRAYHGTPHTFDAFSMEKIGTGEGAQAYGHGLYFAENQMVAKDYQRALSGQGVSREDYLKAFENEYGKTDDKEIEAIADLGFQSYLGGGAAQAASKMQDVAAAFPEGHKLRRAAQLASETIGKDKGSLYGVSLDVEPDELLDWDLPLSKQPEKVREALAKITVEHRSAGPDGVIKRQVPVTEADPPYPFKRAETGADLYKQMGSSVEASRALREAGIPGLRYLDAGSRDGGEGTRNVVMFDETRVRITDRNGNPTTGELP